MERVVLELSRQTKTIMFCGVGLGLSVHLAIYFDVGHAVVAIIQTCVAVHNILI